MIVPVRGSAVNDTRTLVQKIDVPERRRWLAAGLESIYAVVFGGYEDDVVFAFAGNFDAWKIEWLGVDVAIRFQREELSELGCVDILWGEDGFV